jgi:hypothetical protein
MAKIDEKAGCESLKTSKHYRFLTKKEIDALDVGTCTAHNTPDYKQIRLIRSYHSFSAVGP